MKARTLGHMQRNNYGILIWVFYPHPVGLGPGAIGGLRMAVSLGGNQNDDASLPRSTPPLSFRRWNWKEGGIDTAKRRYRVWFNFGRGFVPRAPLQRLGRALRPYVFTTCGLRWTDRVNFISPALTAALHPGECEDSLRTRGPAQVRGLSTSTKYTGR